MKRTTYIMLGAVIAGFIIVAAVTVALHSHPVSKAEYTDSDLIKNLINIETVEETLQPTFSHIVYKDATEGRQRINFGALTIAMSDSVTEAVLRTPKVGTRLVNMAVRNDTLFLTADLAPLNDSIMKLSGIKRLMFDYGGIDPMPLSLTLPHSATLRSVKDGSTSVQLTNIHTSGLDFRSGYRLVLDNCEIDTLRCYGRNLDNLIVSSSVVGLCTMSLPSHEVNINCKKDSGLIKVLEVSGKNSNSRAHELNMTKANVGSVRWLPENDKATLNIIVSQPSELTRLTPAE